METTIMGSVGLRGYVESLGSAYIPNVPLLQGGWSY